MDADARASYDFYFNGTADWQWTASEAALVPEDTAVLHFGSVASWTSPGADHIHAAVSEARQRGRTLISYDPNVRPVLLQDPARAREAVERSVRAAHIVKASREDVEWLYPDVGIEEISARWLELGAVLVVITDGAEGAHVFPAGAAAMSRPGRKVAVADTVGAGDAFTAGCSARWCGTACTPRGHRGLLAHRARRRHRRRDPGLRAHLRTRRRRPARRTHPAGRARPRTTHRDRPALQGSVAGLTGT